jgi:hypothetical protein
LGGKEKNIKKVGEIDLGVVSSINPGVQFGIRLKKINHLNLPLPHHVFSGND